VSCFSQQGRFFSSQLLDELPSTSEYGLKYMVEQTSPAIGLRSINKANDEAGPVPGQLVKEKTRLKNPPAGVEKPRHGLRA